MEMPKTEGEKGREKGKVWGRGREGDQRERLVVYV